MPAYDKVFVLDAANNDIADRARLGALGDAVWSAAGAANARARERRVELTNGGVADLLGDVRFAREGRHEWSGGGVPNSYRHRAESSVLGVVWFTDAGGLRHVRVYAARVAAPKSSGGAREPRAFASEFDWALKHITHVEAVYPELRVLRIPRLRRVDHSPQVLAFLDTLVEDPTDAATWAALSDWLGEHWGDNIRVLGLMDPRKGLARAAALGAKS